MTWSVSRVPGLNVRYFDMRGNYDDGSISWNATRDGSGLALES
jgi:hypothetical protein